MRWERAEAKAAETSIVCEPHTEGKRQFLPRDSSEWRRIP